jgi:NAD dependent epimerase/dehydratase family enzyme
MRRPTVLPLPAFALKLLFGRELAGELLLTGTKVVPSKLQEAQFQFKYPDLQSALSELVNGETKAKE